MKRKTKPAPGADRGRYVVPNLDRALSVVELLSGLGEGLSVSEISEALRIPKNSAFRIAVTLESRGYLARNEVTKRYRLTRKFLLLGAGAAGGDGLLERSIDVMRRLRDETKETTLLGVVVGGDGVVLDSVPGLHRFRFDVDPGTRFYLHTAAPGKAVLAAMDAAARDEVLGELLMPRFNANTITDPAEFRQHLDEVAARGYAFDLAEEMEGQYCVGAAVVDATGAPVAALWVTAPSSRIADSDLERVGRVVKRHADEISARFGYAGHAEHLAALPQG